MLSLCFNFTVGKGRERSYLSVSLYSLAIGLNNLEIHMLLRKDLENIWGCLGRIAQIAFTYRISTSSASAGHQSGGTKPCPEESGLST